jgi:hypothetical protein
MHLLLTYQLINFNVPLVLKMLDINIFADKPHNGAFQGIVRAIKSRGPLEISNIPKNAPLCSKKCKSKCNGYPSRMDGLRFYFRIAQVNDECDVHDNVFDSRS